MDRRGGGVDTLHLCRGIYPIIREEAKIESGKRGHVGYARRDACALCPLCKWDKPSERSFRIGREERWRGRRTTRSRGAGRGQMVARGWTKGPGITPVEKGCDLRWPRPALGETAPTHFQQDRSTRMELFRPSNLSVQASPTWPTASWKGRQGSKEYPPAPPRADPSFFFFAFSAWWGKRVFTSVRCCTTNMCIGNESDVPGVPLGVGGEIDEGRSKMGWSVDWFAF